MLTCSELRFTRLYLDWQFRTKYLTLVSFNGNLVPTKGTSQKGLQTGPFKCTRLPDLNISHCLPHVYILLQDQYETIMFG